MAKEQADLEVESKMKTNTCFPYCFGIDAVMAIARDGMVLSEVDVKIKTVKEEQASMQRP